MRHDKSGTTCDTSAQGVVDRGYSEFVAVSMDIVDEGQVHLDAQRELSDRGGNE